MKLTVNREYVKRHVFAIAVMAGLGLWFGWDGVVRYPSLSGAELYREIEKADPPEGLDLEAFKRQKTQTQYGFAILGLAAAAVVWLRLAKSCRFSCAFDRDGYEINGRRHAFAEVGHVDRSHWNSKGILKVDGIVFDSWHHNGVAEFESCLAAVEAKAKA